MAVAAKLRETSSADAHRRKLLDSLSGGSSARDVADGSGHRHPESMYDRAMALRIAVSDDFANLLSSSDKCRTSSQAKELSGAGNAASGVFLSAPSDDAPLDGLSTSSVRYLETTILTRIQRLADELPRSVYQHQVQESMRREFKDHLHALQQQHQQLVQLQVAAAQRRLLGGVGDSQQDDALATQSSFAGTPQLQSPTAGRGSRQQRPASASGFSTETFDAAQLRHLYHQLHESKCEVQRQESQIAALKAFCVRKDAAVEYIKETLLHEVVVLKEQLRRQEHDPNFVSDFVTLFDCWKVLSGDDPNGGEGGESSGAVKQAKKELQAEAARLQSQFQVTLRRKDEEIAALEAKLASAANSPPAQRKKSLKKSDSDDFHSQFLQLTSDAAKKDSMIGDLKEEIKQLQTEVAIAQQLAKSTRDQLNRSSLDVEEAIASRDHEIVVKTELIATLEAEIRQWREAAGEEQAKRHSALHDTSNAHSAILAKVVALEGDIQDVQQQLTVARKTLQQREMEMEELRKEANLSGDERLALLERQVKEKTTLLSERDKEVQSLRITLSQLETALDDMSSKYETAKFESSRMRSTLKATHSSISNVMETSNETVPLEMRSISMVEPDVSVTCQDAIPNAPPSDIRPSDSNATVWALERRLQKEISIANELQQTNERLKAELRTLREANPVVLESQASASSPRSAESKLKSPQETNTRRARTTSAKDRVELDAEYGPEASKLLQAKDCEIEVLRSELDSLRAAAAERTAEVLSAAPMATYAFHVQQQPPSHSDAIQDDVLDVLPQPTIAVQSVLLPAAVRSTATAATAKGNSGATLMSNNAMPQLRKVPSAKGGAAAQNRDTENSRSQGKSSTVSRVRPADAPASRQAVAPDELGPFQSGVDPLARGPTPEDDLTVVSYFGEPGVCDNFGSPNSLQQRLTASLSPMVDDQLQPLVRTPLTNSGLDEPLSVMPTEAPSTQATAALLEQISTMTLDMTNLHRALDDSQQKLTEVTNRELEARRHVRKLQDEVQQLQDRLQDVVATSRLELGKQQQQQQQQQQQVISVTNDESTETDLDPPPSLTQEPKSAEAPPVELSNARRCDVTTQTPPLEHQRDEKEAVVSDDIPVAAVTPPLKSKACKQNQNPSEIGIQTDLTMAVLQARLQQERPRCDSAKGLPGQRAGAGTDALGNAAAPVVDIAPIATISQQQRVFSAHRRAVHNAGNSVSVQQRLDEPSFYVSGGESSFAAAGSSEDANSSRPVVGNALPPNRVIRSGRPVGSAGQRPTSAATSSAGVVDRLNHAVAVAKGLSDTTKARSAASANSGGDEGGDRFHDGIVGTSSIEVVGGVMTASNKPRLLERPKTPAILTVGPEITTMAREQLQQRTLTSAAMFQEPTIATDVGLAVAVPADTSVAVVSAARTADIQTANATQAPNTVDTREHVTQVLFGAGGEQSALRGVKDRIKQNINVEKFIGKVLLRKL